MPRSCDACGGELTYEVYEEDDSSQDWEGGVTAPEHLTRLCVELLDTSANTDDSQKAYFFDVDVLTERIGRPDALRVRAVLDNFLAELARLPAPERICPACGAALEELFERNNVSRGFQPRQAPDSLRQAFVRLADLCIEHKPANFNSDNDMYEEGDERAPFFSESFLYVLDGKGDMRALRGRLLGIAAAAGIKDAWRIL